MAAKTKLLTPEDWLKAAFQALAYRGPQAVKVDLIARHLEVSRGSFYWHFKNYDALKSAMIDHWRSVVSDTIIAGVDKFDGAPREQLQHLIHLVANRTNSDVPGGVSTEVAIRNWAQSEPAIAAAVKAVDQKRIAYLDQLLRKCGTSSAKAKAYSLLIYSTVIGLESLITGDAKGREKTLLALLELALSDT